ncbi:metallophosphoesterase family protein [Thalassoroseus pseudoceratinae]|uniref:hypothetical protein n=1 Tax=Thalassoroseus pseudoceratinae TaxID=2713176 RepID=UPI001420AF25|nr:hypothetical protein [Thalassoroseus pseudoceratinae]
MTFASLTFLHIADARLDCPLEYIGDVPEDLLDNIDDATLTAFELAVETAKERQVDFVLLTGATFIDSDLSLRARIALVDGLKNLAGDDIAVFVVPSDEAPLPAWRAISDLPENVTICEPGVTLPVHRDHETIATVWAGAETEDAVPYVNGHTNGATNGHHRHVTPFRLGVMTAPIVTPLSNRPDRESIKESNELPKETDWQRPSWARPTTEPESEIEPQPSQETPVKESARFNYLTWASQTGRFQSELLRQTNGESISRPLTTQPLRDSERAQAGVKLVEVRPDGRQHETVLPTAVVRFDCINIDVPNEITRDDLLTTMAEALLDAATDRDEDFLLIQWELRGTGTLWASLRDRTTWESLLEDVILTAEPPQSPILCHAVRLHRAMPVDFSNESLPTRFAQRLDSLESLTTHELSQRLEDHWQAVPEAERVVGGRELLDEHISSHDKDAIRQLAWTIGNDWLQNELETNA